MLLMAINEPNKITTKQMLTTIVRSLNALALVAFICSARVRLEILTSFAATSASASAFAKLTLACLVKIAALMNEYCL